MEKSNKSYPKFIYLCHPGNGIGQVMVDFC